MIFSPQIEGSVSIGSTAPQFLEAFGERVRAGLLTGHPHPRSRYLVADTGAGRLAVSAADWWTALNVGLNEIELRLRPAMGRCITACGTGAGPSSGSL